MLTCQESHLCVSLQMFLQQNLKLSVLEQEVMDHVSEVKEEAELLRVGFDKYSHLWQRSRKGVFQEFLNYGRQLGPEEPKPAVTPPTLKDFQREVKCTPSDLLANQV